VTYENDAAVGCQKKNQIKMNSLTRQKQKRFFFYFVIFLGSQIRENGSKQNKPPPPTKKKAGLFMQVEQMTRIKVDNV